MTKPSGFALLLQARLEAEKAPGRTGILRDPNLVRQFRPGEKPQPIIRRGGRNGSGKP